MLCIRLVFNEHDRLAGEQSCSICLGRVSLRQVSIDSEEQAKTETLGDASRLLLKDSGGFRWHDFGRGHVPEPKPAIKQSWGDPIPRSEEHTSELQSLMRISYAVFCLKKKTKK